MARFATIVGITGILAACAGQVANPPWDQSPGFNNCWDLFPPGPNFQQQLEEYAGTTDPNVTVLGCIPTYHLNEAACQRFKKVGTGEWPDPVVEWCQKYFDVTLDKGVPNK